ncbi:C40 family peptidase [Arthrobacter rhizosphaerae]|uniref:C40 family peptidase n=1 Tax=Arthrobacter rhizosphaerae TaxID=2855490 RepID=UPI001FF6E5E8|nr:C40 family peptidase [Arthrobacter rhizosphaerae]
MPIPAMVAALAKRRALLRGATVMAVVVALMFGVVFCAFATVLVANRSSMDSVCISGSAVGERSPDRIDGGLEIHVSGLEPLWLNSRQVTVASGYISVGKQLGVPRDAWIIAIMMALQESTLRVLANSNVPASFQFPHDGVGRDHDSIGSAQQRPAAGWGSVEQLMDLGYNARAFYGGPSGPNRGSPRGLLDIAGWQSMDKGQAAQAVQISAFPELYARWESQATAIVNSLEGDTAPAVCTDSPIESALPAATGDLSQIRKDILRFTQAGVGGTYIWGGEEFKAWDCSGYVQWIYAQVGINLPRVEQWRVGQRTENPQPGDLVVQNPQGLDNWGHVGIYAGNGMMYSALNPAAGTLLHPVDWNPGSAYFDLLTSETVR